MKNYIHFKELDSTNIYAKKEALKGAPEGTVIIADKQTGGYGRMKRTFFSPEATGLYMSIILRPSLSPQKLLYITTAAAVAVSLAIEELSGQKAEIKWVNDIYIDGKKVCGILTEAAFSSPEITDYAVLGIGVNISLPQKGFDPSIKDIAGAIFDSCNDPHYRIRLADNIIDRFLRYYENIETKDFLPLYREKCFLIGKSVRVIGINQEYDALVLGIDDDFQLIVERNGTPVALYSGEVSVKV